MDGTIIESINYSPQEYLEVKLYKPLSTPVHAFYLSFSHLLTCFVHLSMPSFLYFDTQNYVSLKHYLNHQVISKNDLKEWCLFLLEQFELEDDGYYLTKLEYIFVDDKAKKILLCKIPLHQSQDIYAQFVKLMLDIYECMNYEDDEEWISQMYLLLKQKPFRLGLFKQFLTSKKNKRWLSFFKKDDDDLQEFFKMMQVKESEPLYQMTTLPFETQVLMAGFQYGYFVDERQQKILITSSPWIIGRQKDCHFIFDFPEISKVHCRVCIENGSCFIQDEGSTNGTYVNDKRLVPKEKILLKDQDEIKIAGHKLIYYV